MTTIAQKWAQKRNYLKARMKGATHLFNNRQNGEFFTLNEKDKIDRIAKILDQLLYEWDESNAISKENYLKENA